MKLSEDIKPISYIKSHSADVVDYVNQTKRPVIITQHGEARAVLIDIQSYEKNRETTILLKLLAQGLQETDEGKLEDHRSVIKSLRKKYKA